MRALFPLLLALLFVAAACDSDSGGGDSPDDFAGSYDASVSGAVTQSHDGVASFGSGQNTSNGGTGFAISMAPSIQSNQPTITILGERTRPGTGTYDLGAPSSGGSLGATYFGGGTQVFIGTSGTLTITRSSDDRLDGTFRFDAASATGGGQVTVTGSFEANGATITTN